MKAPDKMPPARPRAKARGEEIWTLTVELETTTVMLGGGIENRKVGVKGEEIRVPSIRGALRQQWRALYGGEFKSMVEMSRAEQQIWGGVRKWEEKDPNDPSKKEKFGVMRSEVELRVYGIQNARKDTGDVDWQTDGFYALWPAQGQDNKGPGQKKVEPAERYEAGLKFMLEVRAPKNLREQVEDSVRAWILFGGYGARTRRGLGSLRPTTPTASAKWECSGQKHTGNAWLPATTKGLEALFHLKDGLWKQKRGQVPTGMPVYQGAALLVGRSKDANQAWLEALKWLKDFRQGQPQRGQRHDYDPNFARERGQSNKHPGRSNWPESDKIRNLNNPNGSKKWAHPSRHNKLVVWPRASFGLPIVGQFKDSNDPGKFVINWATSDDLELKGRDREEKVQNRRLASALIVKGLPLSTGQSVPCLLWMFRGFPDGEVVLTQDKRLVAKSEAPFDQLNATDDKPLYEPLKESYAAPFRMRVAFLEWVVKTYERDGVSVVQEAPIKPQGVRG